MLAPELRGVHFRNESNDRVVLADNHYNQSKKKICFRSLFTCGMLDVSCAKPGPRVKNQRVAPQADRVNIRRHFTLRRLLSHAQVRVSAAARASRQ
jgi:hypothetical protein